MKKKINTQSLEAKLNDKGKTLAHPRGCPLSYMEMGMFNTFNKSDVKRSYKKAEEKAQREAAGTKDEPKTITHYSCGH